MLRTLCGLAWPAAGEVRWNGTEIRRLGDEFHERMAYVGHHIGVIDEFTAYENLRVCALPRVGASDDEQTFAVLQRMELAGCAELPG